MTQQSPLQAFYLCLRHPIPIQQHGSQMDRSRTSGVIRSLSHDVIKRLLLLVGLLFSFSALADDYRRGYTQAILDMQSREVPIEAVTVEDGIVRLRSEASVPQARRTVI